MPSPGSLYLGIAQSNHGSAAALYDGARLLAANEERFDRIKFSSGFPHRTIEWCLRAAEADVGDLAGVGFHMTSGNYLRSTRRDHAAQWRHYPEALYSVLSQMMQHLPDGGGDVRQIRQTTSFYGGRELDLVFVDHHLAHAAASFLPSGFQRAAILCLDGTGDGYSMTLGRGNGTEIELFYRQPFPHSLGQFYATFTQFLGFHANSDEYKVMGLAAYGDPARFYEPVRSLVRVADDGSFELDLRCFSFYLTTSTTKYNERFIELLGLPPNREREHVPQEYRDLAAAVQAVTEEVVGKVLGALHRRTGEEALCYGGGVALNCLANGHVFADSGFRELFIPPNPGDGGLAIGAAMYLQHVADGAQRQFVYEDDFLGPSYTDGEIADMLRENGIRFQTPDDVGAEVAKRLADSKIVGHFDGRQEFGPRALGNRSILADPRPAESKAIVNRKIKFREPFRPFAPSALEENAREVFELRAASLQPSAPESFMLTIAPVRDGWRERLQAVTHADGTARLQTVFAARSPRYHRVIEAFREETGVPAVLNTSFNVNGEPIVLSPQDALRCFYSTGMDSLAIGPFLVDKDA